jgi:transcriptional regulator with XRE-family HTH domain
VEPGDEDRRLMAEFGGSLRAARERAGLTQEQVAQRLGLTQSFVSHVERGRRNLTTTAMGAFARAIGCKLTFLFTPNSVENR